MEVANGLVKGHETGVDLSASVELSSVSRTSAKVFGGPTFYRFGADVLGIKDVVTESGVGYNVGGDMSYFFSKAVGAGGTVWVSRTGEDTYTHFGGGVRFRF